MSYALIDLIETAIVADLGLDAFLANYSIRKHDQTGMKGGDDAGSGTGEKPAVITVTATDNGDFKQVPGSGIKSVTVEIEVQVNVGYEDQIDPDLLKKLATAVDLRVTTGREDFFSNSALKVYGIIENTSDKRSDFDLTRERVLSQEFIAVQRAP